MKNDLHFADLLTDKKHSAIESLRIKYSENTWWWERVKTVVGVSLALRLRYYGSDRQSTFDLLNIEPPIAIDPEGHEDAAVAVTMATAALSWINEGNGPMALNAAIELAVHASDYTLTKQEVRDSFSRELVEALENTP